MLAVAISTYTHVACYFCAAAGLSGYSCTRCVAFMEQLAAGSALLCVT